jgi:hypothetical protein
LVAGSEEGNRNFAPLASDAVPFHDSVSPKGLFTVSSLATPLARKAAGSVAAAWRKVADFFGKTAKKADMYRVRRNRIEFENW